MAKLIHLVTDKIVVPGGNLIAPINLQNRVQVSRMILVSPDQATFTADLYSRAFTSAPVNLGGIGQDGNGKTQLYLPASLPVTVGDVVTVAGASVGGYNVAHRVTSIVDGANLVTDQTYTADATGGTVALSIPTIEQELYRIETQMAGASNKAGNFDPVGFVFINEDPLPFGRSSRASTPIYVKFSVAGTYRASFTLIGAE